MKHIIQKFTFVQPKHEHSREEVELNVMKSQQVLLHVRVDAKFLRLCSVGVSQSNQIQGLDLMGIQLSELIQ